MLMSFIGTFPNALILIDIDRDDEMLADKPSASNMRHLDRKCSTVRSFMVNFRWHDILHEMSLYMVKAPKAFILFSVIFSATLFHVS